MNSKGDTAIMNDKVTISLFELASKYPTDDSARIFLRRAKMAWTEYALIVVQRVSNISITTKVNQDIITVISATRSIQSGQALSLREATSVLPSGFLPFTTFSLQERAYRLYNFQSTLELRRKAPGLCFRESGLR